MALAEGEEAQAEALLKIECKTNLESSTDTILFQVLAMLILAGSLGFYLHPRVIINEPSTSFLTYILLVLTQNRLVQHFDSFLMFPTKQSKNHIIR